MKATRYIIRPEYRGLQISRKVWPSQMTITLDCSSPRTSAELGNYYAFDEFKDFIMTEEYEDGRIDIWDTIEYRGVPHQAPETSETLPDCTCPESCETHPPVKQTRKSSKKTK